MNQDEFWTLVERHVSFDGGYPVVDGLAAALAKLPKEEIASFDSIFAGLMRQSYTQSLWGAAYVINGGCSDDGFDYFRGWLIARGRKAFENAVRDPDSLVEIAEEDLECEDFLYLAMQAYEKVSGGEELPNSGSHVRDLGDGWDFDDADEMKKRYPKLCAKFGWD